MEAMMAMLVLAGRAQALALWAEQALVLGVGVLLVVKEGVVPAMILVVVEEGVVAAMILVTVAVQIVPLCGAQTAADLQGLLLMLLLSK
jgi:hypothetical protein